jgi:hypothetical protein
VNRQRLEQRVEAVITPMLARGEELHGCGPVWAVEQRERVPLAFRARGRYILALTDQRLILLGAPRWRRPLTVSNLVLAKRYDALELERVGRLRPLLQVRLRTPDARTIVLEFRPRNRRLGRELASAFTERKLSEEVSAQLRR